MLGADDARDPWRWGFGLAIVLAVLVGGLSIMEVQRARREVTRLARTADRSTYLVGEIGRQVSRMRALALDRLVRPEAWDAAVEDRELGGIVVALDATLAELEPLVQPRERTAWRSFLRVLGRFRAEIERAMDAIGDDRSAWAGAVLVHRVPRRAARLQERLDEFRLLNAQESRLLIMAVDRRLSRTGVVEAALGGALVVALFAIWWAVQGTIARQRRQLERYVARIEASNRDLDAFAGRIAHDVRNAVAPLSLAAAALRQAPGRAEVALRIAGQVERAVQRTRALLEGLLAFSRPGWAAEVPARASVPQTVEAVVEELAPLAQRVGADVDVRSDDVAVGCGPGLLHIVVVNLVGNALKFLAGRPERRVRIAARADGSWCELTVEDTGPGIPREAVPRIFEPFYRVPGTVEPGTGIGLATVQRIVAAHGGSIDVDSELGRGTTFRVRLPLHEAGVVRDLAPEESRPRA